MTIDDLSGTRIPNYRYIEGMSEDEAPVYLSAEAFAEVAKITVGARGKTAEVSIESSEGIPCIYVSRMGEDEPAVCIRLLEEAVATESTRSSGHHEYK